MKRIIENISVIQRQLHFNLPDYYGDGTVIYSATLMRRHSNDGIILFLSPKDYDIVGRYAPNNDTKDAKFRKYRYKLKFYNPSNFFKYFEILDRRVLVEKTGSI